MHTRKLAILLVLVAVGAALFGLGSVEAAQIGRLLQGAGSACVDCDRGKDRLI